MKKLTCTLEFKEGRPIAKECNKYGDKPKFSKGGQAEWLNHKMRLKLYKAAENSRREFEISQDDYGWLKSIGCREGFKFTATIENNIVTKIELL